MPPLARFLRACGSIGTREDRTMTQPNWPQGLPGNFGGLDDEFSNFEGSKIAVLPVPYDFSTSYQSGTRLGPRAMIEASRNMEVWDDELGATYRAGIHTLPELEPTALGPGAMVERVEHAVGWIYENGKLPAMFGGEHSIHRAPCAPRSRCTRSCPCFRSTRTRTCAMSTSTLRTVTPA